MELSNLRPAIVASTTFCLLLEPNALERIFLYPASSRTAREGQMLGGIDWDSIVLTLRSLPAGQSRPSADFSAYSRELGLTASVEAVREVLQGAGIRAAVSWQDGRCVITPVDIRDRAAIETLLAVNAGDLPWCIAEGTP